MDLVKEKEEEKNILKNIYENLILEKVVSKTSKTLTKFKVDSKVIIIKFKKKFAKIIFKTGHMKCRANFDDGSTMRLHTSLLSNTIRSRECGPSNSCKTNDVINLLFKPNGLVYVFSKSIYRLNYKCLESVMENTTEMENFTLTDNEIVTLVKQSR